MSGWNSYQDKPRGSASAHVARLVVDHPGLFTAVYLEQRGLHSAVAVKAALHRLKHAGYVRSTRRAGNAGRGKAHEVQWHPTPMLVEMIRRGETPVIGRDIEPPLPDDGWTPPPYVTAIRARALGLPVRS